MLFRKRSVKKTDEKKATFPFGVGNVAKKHGTLFYCRDNPCGCLIVISYCDVQTIEWTSQRLSNYLSS